MAAQIIQRIYALVDPRTDAIRYVGVTSQQLETRLSMHLSSVSAGKTSPVYQWIAELRELGLRPTIKLVEETHDRLREMYWIAFFRERGMDLTNSDDGAGFGRSATAEEHANRSASHMGKTLSLEHRIAQSQGRRKAAHDRNNRGQSSGADSNQRAFSGRTQDQDSGTGSGAAGPGFRAEHSNIPPTEPPRMESVDSDLNPNGARLFRGFNRDTPYTNEQIAATRRIAQSIETAETAFPDVPAILCLPEHVSEHLR